jgi:hypothetical protein
VATEADLFKMSKEMNAQDTTKNSDVTSSRSKEKRRRDHDSTMLDQQEYAQTPALED